MSISIHASTIILFGKTPEELRQGLAARISAVIGDGPYKENSGH